MLIGLADAPMQAVILDDFAILSPIAVAIQYGRHENVPLQVI